MYAKNKRKKHGEQGNSNRENVEIPSLTNKQNEATAPTLTLDATHQNGKME